MSSRIVCIVIIVMLSISCKKRQANPELLDPIYVDIVNELRNTQQKSSELEKKIEKAQKDLDLSQPRTLERKNAEKDLLNAKKAYQKSLERIEYLKIREIERKFDDYKTYEAAFKAEKPWPPPEEYKAYLKNKELNNASRNWSDRVPRPSRQTDPNQIVDGDTKEPKK